MIQGKETIVRVFILLLFALPALADDDCRGNHNCGDGGSTPVDVSTNVGGSSTKAISVGGGDMDINQCLATHSVLFGLWQGTHLNKMCIADGLDARGKHEEAAEMRCSVRGFRKVYGSNCVEETMIRPSSPPPPVVPTSGPLLEEVLIAQEEQEEEHESLEARLARIESGQRIASRKAQERRDYAQQTMERIENDPED
jgi:hypothetical protein